MFERSSSSPRSVFLAPPCSIVTEDSTRTEDEAAEIGSPQGRFGDPQPAAARDDDGSVARGDDDATVRGSPESAAVRGPRNPAVRGKMPAAIRGQSRQ